MQASAVLHRCWTRRASHAKWGLRGIAKDAENALQRAARNVRLAMHKDQTDGVSMAWQDSIRNHLSPCGSVRISMQRDCRRGEQNIGDPFTERLKYLSHPKRLATCVYGAARWVTHLAHVTSGELLRNGFEASDEVPAAAPIFNRDDQLAGGQADSQGCRLTRQRHSDVAIGPAFEA
jgi:hypothetical protein